MRIPILLLLLSSTLCLAQEDLVDFDCYKNRGNLTWKDFITRSTTQNDSRFPSTVSTGLDFNWDYNIDNAQQNFSYTVCARLYPGSSWVISSQKDSTLLAHEQLHYDITELYARKLRKVISGYQLGRNIRKDLKLIYDTIEDSRKKMQVKYDIQTIHSKNQEIQHVWDKKIDSLLNTLKIYDR